MICHAPKAPDDLFTASYLMFDSLTAILKRHEVCNSPTKNIAYLSGVNSIGGSAMPAGLAEHRAIPNASSTERAIRLSGSL